MGDAIGDLSSRRGKIGGMTQRADAQVVAASVPLSEMFGYSTTLRSMSQGRAIYSMQFSHYQEVPKTKAEEIVSKVKRSEEHTSELQSRRDLVCRLLLEKKKSDKDRIRSEKKEVYNVVNIQVCVG